MVERFVGFDSGGNSGNGRVVSQSAEAEAASQ